MLAPCLLGNNHRLLNHAESSVAFEPLPSRSNNFAAKTKWNDLHATPFDLGVWALLEPAGTQNHSPQLLWLDSERLACVWMAGGGEGTTSMAIYGSVLQRSKTRWGRPKKLSQDTGRSEQNPLLFKTDDGRLHLIHTAQDTRSSGDGSWKQTGGAFSMQWTAHLRHQSTRDWNRSWTRAHDLLEHPAFCRHPPLRLRDGNWLLPIYRSLETGGAFGHDHSLVLPLDPKGVPTGPAYPVPNSTGRVQGSIVLSQEDGSLLQFFRSRLADRVYRARGTLDGSRWTEPEPVGLPNNNSSLQVIRLNSGFLAAAFNRAAANSLSGVNEWGSAVWPLERWPLSIALSEDDGFSWPWVRDIDMGLGFCGSANWRHNLQLAYPSIVEGMPNELHVAYSWGNRAAIRYVALHVQDIISN